MTWLTWRQYRVVLLCAVVAILLYALSLALLEASDYWWNWSSLSAMTLGLSNTWPFWLGLVVATFIGAPLIAHEREQGTHHFTWTQGIGRTRWLAVKFGLMLLGLVTLSIGSVFIAGQRFALQAQHDAPMNAVYGEVVLFTNTYVYGPWLGFLSTGIVAPAIVIFALVLGTTVGCFVKRNIPAMTTAFLLFLVAFIALVNLYPYLIPSQTYSVYPDRAYPQDLFAKALVIKWVNVDQQGNEIKDSKAYCDSLSATSKEKNGCVLHNKIIYQPAENYWPLQWIVSGILLVLSLGLGVVIFIRVRSSVD